MRTSIALLSLAVASASAQQVDVPTYESSLNMTLPDDIVVDPSTRSTWCRGQYNTCEILCGNEWETNDCEFEDLSYECTCASNSSTPGLQWYTQTMPTFICDKLFAKCIEQNAASKDGTDACNENIGDLCGKIDPPTEAIESGDDDEDDGDDSSETSTATQAPSDTASSTEEEAAPSNTDADGAASISSPKIFGVLAAVGVAAALI